MRTTRQLAAALIVGAVLAGLPVTHAGAAQLPTTVSTAGDYVKLSLAVGAQLVVGGGFTCSSMDSKPAKPLGTNTKNQIPTTGNPSASGPVPITLRKPAVAGCASPGATLAIAQAQGTWKLALQHRATGEVGALKLPKNGLAVGAMAAGIFCTATLAPSGVASILGTWTNGSPSTFKITNAQVPVSYTGCPPGGSGTVSLSVTFAVTDVSNAGRNVVVS